MLEKVYPLNVAERVVRYISCCIPSLYSLIHLDYSSVTSVLALYIRFPIKDIIPGQKHDLAN